MRDRLLRAFAPPFPALPVLALFALALVTSRASHGDAPHTQGNTGRLSINTVPWTLVWVDGKKVKPTPVVNHELKPGKHKVLLVNEEHGIRKKYVVMIEEGMTTILVKKFDADGNEVKPAAPQDAGDSPSSDPPDEVVADASPEPDDAATLGPPPPDLVQAMQEQLTRGSGCGCALVL